MTAHHSAGQELVKGTGRFMVHVLAIVLGLILSVVGIAMGVSIAMLPIGIPVGLAGLFLLMWGLFSGLEKTELPVRTPDRQ